MRYYVKIKFGVHYVNLKDVLRAKPNVLNFMEYSV